MTPMDRHPDRHSPLVFDTRELSRRAGTMREVERTVPAPADLRLEVIEVPEGSDIELDLRLEAVVEGVLVTGTATVQLQGECARCLTGIEDDMSFDLQELFFHPGREVDEEERLVEDESIDLEPVLRDAVVMDLPFTPLCREDCLGLCPECGANLNDDPDHEHDLAVDPRWSKLVGMDVEE
ncbi:MAG: YceD family protein [Arachnia sp.]